MAGLDWEVDERHLEVEQSDGDRKLVHSHKAIVRRDNQHLLGVVGSRYQPIQNSEAFEWLDDLVGERRAMFETAGSINGGKVVWMLLELPMELRIEGTDDVTWPYLLVCNSHDGSRAFRVLRTAVRVAAAATWKPERCRVFLEMTAELRCEDVEVEDVDRVGIVEVRFGDEARVAERCAEGLHGPSLQSRAYAGGWQD